MTKVASFTEAVSWLRDYQDADTPTKMHDRATGDDGAPRLASRFFDWVTRHDRTNPDAKRGDHTDCPWCNGTASERREWAFATTEITEDWDCPQAHPIRRQGEPICVMCDDNLSWKKVRTVYVRPFMAALERLSHVPPTSKDWPAPKELVLRLIAARYNLDAAADAIGHPVLGSDHRATLEAVFTLATRKLADRYSTGPVPRVTRRSESQANAEAAA